MPRHRQDSVPRHRAQRREHSPGRGVPGGRSRRSRWTSRLLSGRTVRSLLMTPWFVAGMGVLITATLVLESPTDAVLSYGPPAGSPCGAPGCVRTTPRHAHGSLASRPSVPLEPAVRPTSRTRHAARGARAPQPTLPPRRVPAGPSAVTVSFRVVSQDHRGFIAMITMYSQDSLGDWTLGFAIPGASIKGVGGARWRGERRRQRGSAGTAVALAAVAVRCHDGQVHGLRDRPARPPGQLLLRRPGLRI